MKRLYYFLILLIGISIGAGVPAHAKSMKDVIGTYSSVTAQNKLWIKELGTDFSTDYYETIKIGKNKNFRAWINGEVYKGKCKVKKSKLIINKTKSLRRQFGNKAIKPWIEDWVRDLGSSISNTKLSYSKFKITKSRINNSGAKSLKITIQGKASGYVAGEGYLSRPYKFQCTIFFNGLD